jgi:hypothetical protein
MSTRGTLVVLLICMCVALLVVHAHHSCWLDFKDDLMNDTLPCFHTFDQLRQEDAWYDYLSKLYSDDQLLTLMPLNIGHLWILFPRLMSPKLLSSLRWSLMPYFYHGIYYLQNPLALKASASLLISQVLWKSPPPELWVYQYRQLPPCRCWFPNYHQVDQHVDAPLEMHSNQDVEIYRGPDDVDTFQWFYYAKGSGIWINLGKTIAFQDHYDAFDFFSIMHNYGVGERSAEHALGKALLEQGYDTIQFTCTHEQVYKFEIMSVRAIQPNSTSPCTSLPAKGRGNVTCVCDPQRANINCMLSES